MPYVYVIKDPRIEGDKNIVFVGTGAYPWESVERHLEKSSNPDVAKWAEGLHASFPEGIEILGRIVCSNWHGDNVPVPERRPGVTRVEWDVVAFDDKDTDESSGSKIVGGTSKTYWIRRLKEEGHPLLNRVVGRPSTRKQRNGVPLTITHVVQENA